MGQIGATTRSAAASHQARECTLQCIKDKQIAPERSKILTRKVQLCSVRHGVMVEGELQLVPRSGNAMPSRLRVP